VRSVIKIARRVVIGLGLTALVMVLFPSYAEPLWTWTSSVSTALGQEGLPPFSRAKDVSGIGLLLLSIGGVMYNAWRDRRYEVLRAEYEYGTGASQLQQKIAGLTRDLAKVTEERDRWQKEYANLNKEHTNILVLAKEHEIHSSYGKEDRETLKDLRAQFNNLLQEKGHTQGFREAIEVMMTHLANSADAPAPASTFGVAVNNNAHKNQQCPPLSYQP